MADQTYSLAQMNALEKLYTEYRRSVAEGKEYSDMYACYSLNKGTLKALASEKAGKLVTGGGRYEYFAKLTEAGIAVADGLFKEKVDEKFAAWEPTLRFNSFYSENYHRIVEKVRTLLNASESDVVALTRGGDHKIGLNLNVTRMIGSYEFFWNEEAQGFGFSIKGGGDGNKYYSRSYIEITGDAELELFVLEMKDLSRVIAVLVEEQQFFQEAYLEA